MTKRLGKEEGYLLKKLVRLYVNGDMREYNNISYYLLHFITHTEGYVGVVPKIKIVDGGELFREITKEGVENVEIEIYKVGEDDEGERFTPVQVTEYNGSTYINIDEGDTIMRTKEEIIGLISGDIKSKYSHKNMVDKYKVDNIEDYIRGSVWKDD